MTHSMDLSVMEQSTLLGELEISVIRELFDRKKLEAPVLLLSRSRVEDNVRALRRALPRAEIYYAVKSNNHPAILTEVFGEGGNFDVCSRGEIDAVLKTGVNRPHLFIPTRSRQSPRWTALLPPPEHLCRG